MPSSDRRRRLNRLTVVAGRHHPGDIARIAVGGVLLASGAAIARTGVVGVGEHDVFRLVNHLPKAFDVPLSAIMQAGALGAVGVVGALLVLTGRVKPAVHTVSAGTLAWSLAKVMKAAVDRGRPADLLTKVIIHGKPVPGLGFPSGHAAVAASLAGALVPFVPHRARRVLWGVACTVALARVYVGAHLPLDAIGGLALGWVVSASVNLALGTPGGELDLDEVQEALVVADLSPRRVQRAEVDARGSTPFFAELGDGRDVFVKAVGREERDADALFKAWRWLALRGIEDEAPFSSPKQQVEHEAFLALLAERAGVRTPSIVTTTRTVSGAFVLVQQRIHARPLEQSRQPNSDASPALTNAQVDDVWTQLKLLREAGIAHRDLRLANVLIDDVGRPWIIDFGFAQSAAAQRHLAQDVAELLVTLSLVVGHERAVDSALVVLGAGVLATAVPFLQPAGLSRATRTALKTRKGLLDTARQLVTERTGAAIGPAGLVTRLRPATLAMVVGLGVAVHLLLPQVGELRRTIDAASGASVSWLLLAVLASALTYVAAAVGLMGSVQTRLQLDQTVLVQMASSFVNRLTPGSIGGLGLNTRYLERSGISRASAVASVGLNGVAGLIMHMAGLVICAGVVGGAGVKTVKLPDGWPALIGAVAVLVVAGVIMGTPRWRQRVLPPAARAARDLVSVIGDRRRALRLFGGSAMVTTLYVLSLAASLRAFGASVGIAAVALSYLGSAAVATVSPAPGGLGAMEAALVASLTALGSAPGPAVAGVLGFRLVTFWLPTLPGWIAFRRVRADGLV